MEEVIYDTVAPDEYSTDENQINENENKNENKNEIENENENKDKNDRNCSSASSITSSKVNEFNSSFSNYVNIDYFLRKEETSSKNDSDDNETHVSQSISSDHEIDQDSVCGKRKIQSNTDTINSANITYDEVFEPNDFGKLMKQYQMLSISALTDFIYLFIIFATLHLQQKVIMEALILSQIHLRVRY